MNYIINIKLNNTRVNPNIWLAVLSKRATEPIHLNQREEKMTAQVQSGAHSVDRSSSRALASLLLAAGVATLVVLADHLLASWAERHEVAAWLILCGIAVAAITLLRGITRALARQAMVALDRWSAAMAKRRADERLWSIAQTDPRIMADLQAALSRSGGHAPVRNLVDLTQRRVERLLRDRMYYI